MTEEVQEKRLVEVELLVRRRIGLNPQAVSPHHFRDAVRERMAACRIEDPSDYLTLVNNREDEFQELVERLIVPESWFFRDLQPFRFLEHFVSAHWHPRHPQRPLRLLSVPCGTGEEPFSMAMTLLNLGLDAGRFDVEGVDISQHVLREAEAGAYGELSFREREETVANYRDRFFRAAGARLVVKNELRSAVHFRRANVVEPAFLCGEQSYDVIFCRNLLIYLDADARATALANLHRLLQEEGVLYVGHVEGGAARNGLFDAYAALSHLPSGPCMGKATGGEAATGKSILRPIFMLPRPPLPKLSPMGGESVARWTSRLTQDDSKAECTAMPTAGGPQAEFEAACQAADRGRLEEAASSCLDLLARQAPRAEVFRLLGVIRQAQGDMGEAEKCFHKALYLDPQHYQGLVHLELLARQRGEESLALNYRRRADKIQREG